MSGWRAPAGGRIDRSRPVEFSFDGRRLLGYAGDTLASALIANGVDIVARSFKYHRPRGIVAFGADEPNALVRLGVGDRAEPNTKATQVPLTPGLVAESQNRWPSLRFDLGAVNGLLAPLIPAGFYYKTFIKPAWAWPYYERLIRRAAGMGTAPTEPDPDRYETIHRHVDVLVIGAGPAGLAAAEAAAETGDRVLLVDDQQSPGGLGTDDDTPCEGTSFARWVDGIAARLRARANVTLLPNASAYGHYDGDLVAIAEQRPDATRIRRWFVQARRIVLASGAYERPLLFAGNDRPGVMMAGAALLYLRRHAAVAGRRCVVFANQDTAYDVALALHAAGVTIAGIVDPRSDTAATAIGRAASLGIPCFPGHRVVRAHGRRRVSGCTVLPIEARGPIAGTHLACDLILTSGGWSPAAHLFTHAGGRLRYSASLDALVPDPATSSLVAVGACAGETDLAACIAAGRAAGRGEVPPPVSERPAPPRIPATGEKSFVDLQNDVTTSDLALAVREGYRSIEHVKRYTTLGMGTDQGKLVGLNGAAIVAETDGRDPGIVGNSRPRPPFQPVTFGAMAGRFVGPALAPARITPIHEWHAANGAVFANVGAWRRSQFYRRLGESDMEAVTREALNVRRAVGITDVSTLGKIDLQGSDVGRLLDHVYVNGWGSLKPGRCRYGVMLREDGIVLDDGTTTRLSADRWFMTTTTGNAERILGHLELARQRTLPDLDVTLTPVTEQRGAMAVAGPRTRELLAALVPDFAIDDAALPYMGLAEGHLAGIEARVLRVSFSGERSYEIYVRSGEARLMWEAIVAAGEPFGLMPYGTEAMMTLRIEKGLFVPGFEADGRTTPDDLGLARMLARHKDFVGKRSLGRPAFIAPERRQLVGLMAVDPTHSIPRGAQIVRDAAAPPPVEMEGNVTSVTYSPNLERWIALGLVAGGRMALGETRVAASPLTGETVPVVLCDPVFFDREGARLRG